MSAPNPAMQPWNDNMDTHIIVARMYAERQRHSIAAVIAGPQEPPWRPAPFLHSGVVTEPIPTTAPRSNDSLIPEPPLMAEFLVNLCARSNRDEFAVGDMRERFTRHCIERSPSRAWWLYWSDAIGYLLLHAFKVAALMAIIKRLFGL